jgi:hypothetical protein
MGVEMGESELSQDIMKVLKRTMPWVMNVTSGVSQRKGYYMRLAPKGTADIIGLTWKGECFCIEVKGKYGKLTPEQEKFRDLMLSIGVTHIIARSVEGVLKGLGYESR